jgi:hypothetical protein
MMRPVALPAALLLAFAATLPAAGAPAPAAGAFEHIPLDSPRQHGHAWAYVSLAAGAGLVGASFAFSRHADRIYDDYLGTTDPAEIDRLYDRTVRFDRLSTGALLSGEALIALGLYLRFLRRPPEARLSFELGPERCAATWRF